MRLRETGGTASAGTEIVAPPSRLIVLVIALAAGFSLAVGWYQLLGMGEWHQYLEYDDGVWFGTAVRLAHGILPYRSFVDDQPPGVPVLMLPFALWSRSVGTRSAFAAARLAVPLVESVGVVALGWTVRHRGVLTTTIACGVMAVYPLCLIDQRTVMLEPFCATFCLLGLATVFHQDHLSARSGRLAVAGACFGLAGACKAFALLPFVVVVAALLVGPGRRRLGAFMAGTAASFAVLCGPFLVVAPGAFLHDVVVTQFSRSGVSEPSRYDRLASLVGSPPSTVPGGLSDHQDRELAVIIAVLVAVLVVSSYMIGRPWPWSPRARPGTPLEAEGGTGMVRTPGCHRRPRRRGHRDGPQRPGRLLLPLRRLFWPFLALMLGLAAGRLARRAPVVLSLCAVTVLAVGAVHAVQTVRASPGGLPNVALIDRLVPPGACVLGDDAPTLVLANRFSSRTPGCNAVTDAFGTTISSDGGYPADTPQGHSAPTVATWLDALERSNYVVLALGFQERRIPWGSPVLHNYLSSHFQALTSSGDIVLRRRRP